jgi:hypothetical protein
MAANLVLAPEAELDIAEARIANDMPRLISHAKAPRRKDKSVAASARKPVWARSGDIAKLGRFIISV